MKIGSIHAEKQFKSAEFIDSCLSEGRRGKDERKRENEKKTGKTFTIEGMLIQVGMFECSMRKSFQNAKASGRNEEVFSFICEKFSTIFS